MPRRALKPLKTMHAKQIPPIESLQPPKWGRGGGRQVQIEKIIGEYFVSQNDDFTGDNDDFTGEHPISYIGVCYANSPRKRAVHGARACA